LHAFCEDHDPSDRARDGSGRRGVRAIHHNQQLELDVGFELHVVVQFDVRFEFHDGVKCDDLDQAEAQNAQTHDQRFVEQFDELWQFDEFVVLEHDERFERSLSFLCAKTALRSKWSAARFL
jgi:hypothetical protein